MTERFTRGLAEVLDVWSGLARSFRRVGWGGAFGRLALALSAVMTVSASAEDAQLAGVEVTVWRVTGGLTVVNFYEDLLAKRGVFLTDIEETARTPPFVGAHGEPPYVAFAIDPSSTLEFTAVEGLFMGYEGGDGVIRHRGGFCLWLPSKGGGAPDRLEFHDFVITTEALAPDTFFDANRDFLYLRDGREGSPLAVRLRQPMRKLIDLSPASAYAKYSAGSILEIFSTFDDGTSLFWMGTADLIITEEGARAVGRPDLAGALIGLGEVCATADLVGRRAPTEAEIAAIRRTYPNVGRGRSPASAGQDRDAYSTEAEPRDETDSGSAQPH